MAEAVSSAYKCLEVLYQLYKDHQEAVDEEGKARRLVQSLQGTLDQPEFRDAWKEHPAPNVRRALNELEVASNKYADYARRVRRKLDKTAGGVHVYFKTSGYSKDLQGLLANVESHIHSVTAALNIHTNTAIQEVQATTAQIQQDVAKLILEAKQARVVAVAGTSAAKKSAAQSRVAEWVSQTQSQADGSASQGAVSSAAATAATVSKSVSVSVSKAASTVVESKAASTAPAVSKAAATVPPSTKATTTAAVSKATTSMLPPYVPPYKATSTASVSKAGSSATSSKASPSIPSTTSQASRSTSSASVPARNDNVLTNSAKVGTMHPDELTRRCNTTELIQKLTGADTSAQRRAAEVCAELLERCGRDPVKAFVREGGIRALMQVLDRSQSVDVLRNCLRACKGLITLQEDFTSIAKNNYDIALVEAGLIPKLIRLAKCQNGTVEGHAAEVMGAMAVSPRLAPQLVSAGALNVLNAMLRSGDSFAREEAENALRWFPSSASQGHTSMGFAGPIPPFTAGPSMYGAPMFGNRPFQFGGGFGMNPWF